MSSRFVSVLRQAFKTFDRSNQTSQAFIANLTLLKQLTEQLTFHDFHFSQQDLLSDMVFEREECAPCAYVHIFENDIVSMGVFVLRGGYTMPLHDHPMMHGVLRGIYGRLNVQSYTQKFQPGEVPTYDRTIREVPVVAEEPRIVSTDTECAMLSPHERNFHAISAVGGVAAFFDILSPPYDADIPIYGSRRCRFYRLESGQSPNQTLNETKSLPATQQHNDATALRLVRIPVPRWYYCDTVEAPEAVVKSLQSYVDVYNYIKISE